jgi:hypothetical protein
MIASKGNCLKKKGGNQMCRLTQEGKKRFLTIAEELLSSGLMDNGDEVEVGQ